MNINTYFFELLLISIYKCCWCLFVFDCYKYYLTAYPAVYGQFPQAIPQPIAAVAPAPREGKTLNISFDLNIVENQQRNKSFISIEKVQIIYFSFK